MSTINMTDDKLRMSYGKVKSVFYNKFEELASNKLVMYSCLQREKYETIVKEIKKAKVLQYLKRSSSPLQEDCMKKYDVVDDDGDKLIAKKIDKDNNFSVKRILIKEEVFDVIADAHTKHNQSLFKKIKNSLLNYFIPDVLIQLFLNSCDICKKNSPWLAASETNYFDLLEETPTLDLFISKEFSMKESASTTNENVNIVPSHNSEFNREVYVALIDMRWNPDGNFEGLLCYYDIETGYLLLRAINDLTNEQEITMELLQIFMDFGRPDKLLITNKNVYAKLEEIMKLCPDLQVKYNPQYSKHPIDAKTIVLMLQNWMTQNCCVNWAFGCRVVQYQFNMLKNHDISPYLCVFNREPCNIFLKQTDHPKSIPSTTKRKVKEKSVVPNSTKELESNKEMDTEMHEETEDFVFIVEGEEDVKPDLELLTIEETQLLKVPSHNINCYICNKLLMDEGYTCSVCGKEVHLFCCERFLDLEAPVTSGGMPAMKTTCLVCKA